MTTEILGMPNFEKGEYKVLIYIIFSKTENGIFT